MAQNLKDITNATNDIICEIQDYEGGYLEDFSVTWDVKQVNGEDILIPVISAKYLPDED